MMGLALALAVTGLHGAISGPARVYVLHNDISQQPDPKKKEVSASTKLENEALTLTAYFPNDDQPVKIGLYNILGKLIEIHPSTSAQKGEQSYRFTTKGLPSGPYIVVLETNGQRIVNKVMVSR